MGRRHKVFSKCKLCQGNTRQLYLKERDQYITFCKNCKNIEIFVHPRELIAVEINDLIECAKRELSLRKKCYPKWVTQNRMSQDEANHELACMSEILELLKSLENKQKELF